MTLISALRIITGQLTEKRTSDAKSCSESKFITMDEVYNHDEITDCWIIIYDRVYDVTNFLKSHPGGREVLFEYAGRDATLAFRSTGHTKEAFLSLKQYEIGLLPKHERMYDCIKSDYDL